MINSLNGIITQKDESKICIELNGIEWELIMPFNSINKLPPTGEKAKIYTYLQHSQDIMQLFGFFSQRERSLFFDLIKVNGVGPRQAIKILSGIEIDDFIKQLDDNDLDSLTRLPGLGKKTAQKIILALRGNLSFTEPATSNNEYNDIINALVDMGFDRKSSEKAVTNASKEQKDSSASSQEKEQAIFKRAIILLSS
ncbi:MAG: Holliday junction branch migration protein RuvA [Spirochaetales bacterium]|nr:Holliday junction branch migration protein RuvA [Spirochaetales bacterium]